MSSTIYETFDLQSSHIQGHKEGERVNNLDLLTAATQHLFCDIVVQGGDEPSHSQISYYM